MLIYDIGANKWFKPEVSGDLPSLGSMGHTATKIEKEQEILMLVLGGDNKGDAYALNLLTMEWQKIKNVSYKRIDHTADGLR